MNDCHIYDRAMVLRNDDSNSETLIFKNNHLPKFDPSSLSMHFPRVENLILIQNAIENFCRNSSMVWGRLQFVKFFERELKLEEPFILPLSILQLHLELEMITEEAINGLPDNLFSLIVANTEIGRFNSVRFTREFSIRTLILWNCFLKIVEFDWFFLELEYLDMSHNSIETLQYIGKLPKLFNLNVSYNRLVEINDVYFVSMPLLHNLNLKHNNIHTLQPSSFRSSLNLNSVYLSFNEIWNVTIVLRNPEQNYTKVILNSSVLKVENETLIDANGVYILTWPSNKLKEKADMIVPEYSTDNATRQVVMEKVPNRFWEYLSYSLLTIFGLQLVIYVALKIKRRFTLVVRKKTKLVTTNPGFVPSYIEVLPKINREYVYDNVYSVP